MHDRRMARLGTPSKGSGHMPTPDHSPAQEKCYTAVKIVEKVKADGRSCEDQTFSPEKESVNVAVEKKDGNKEE